MGRRAEHAGPDARQVVRALGAAWAAHRSLPVAVRARRACRLALRARLPSAGQLAQNAHARGTAGDRLSLGDASLPVHSIPESVGLLRRARPLGLARPTLAQRDAKTDTETGSEAGATCRARDAARGAFWRDRAHARGGAGRARSDPSLADRVLSDLCRNHRRQLARS